MEKEKDLVERWEPSGLLEDIDKERKLELARALEKTGKHLVAMELKGFDPLLERVGGIIFCIIRRIYTELNVSIGKFEFIVDVIGLIDEIKEWYKTMENKIMLLEENFYSSMYIEAEICSIFTTDYINDLKKRHIIK